MMSRIRNVRCYSILILLLLALLCQAGYLSADRCAEAFFKCVEDPLMHLMLGGPLFCANGYIFCLKYLG